MKTSVVKKMLAQTESYRGIKQSPHWLVHLRTSADLLKAHLVIQGLGDPQIHFKQFNKVEFWVEIQIPS